MVRPTWIFHWKNFSYFWSTSPRCLLPCIESIGLSVQKKRRKIDFPDGSNLGFPIGTILAIFDLHVTPMLPTKFRVNSPFGSWEEEKNRFSRWPPWQPSCISELFLIYKSPRCSVSFGPLVQEKMRKIDFQDGRYHGFLIGMFWSTSHSNASSKVSSPLAQGCRRSRLLKQLLMLHDGHWPITIAHHEHFVLRWAKNYACLWKLKHCTNADADIVPAC